MLNKNKVQQYTYDGAGFLRQYENSEWTVAIKNHKETSGEDYVKSLDRHLQTDEVFILLQGKCILVYALEENNSLKFGFIDMEVGAIYVVPQNLWHNTITYEETKVIIVENSNTTMDNSEAIDLDKALIKYRQGR